MPPPPPQRRFSDYLEKNVWIEPVVTGSHPSPPPPQKKKMSLIKMTYSHLKYKLRYRTITAIASAKEILRALLLKPWTWYYSSGCEIVYWEIHHPHPLCKHTTGHHRQIGLAPHKRYLYCFIHPAYVLKERQEYYDTSGIICFPGWKLCSDKIPKYVWLMRSRSLRKLIRWDDRIVVETRPNRRLWRI